MIPLSLLRPALAVVLVVLLSIVFPNAATHAVPAAPQANAVRISQVYGGGGSSVSYRCDYIELFNGGSSPVNLNGWSIQVFNEFAVEWWARSIGNVTIDAGHFSLAQAGCAQNSGTPLPNPDIILDMLYLNTMPTASGKVALVSNSETITGKSDSDVVDFVGYGAANEWEGNWPAPALSTTTAAFRAGGGCTDTDDNAADFTATTPSPRNSASATHICAVDAAPAVSGVLPADGATDVALDANVIVTFSEPVDVAAGWYSLSCDLGGPVAATVTGGPTAWTIDPAADLEPDDGCQLTIYDEKVSDTDTTDPPDNMAADFVSSFSTRAGQCGEGATLIHTIQGAGSVSPLVGEVRTVEGVVVGDFTGATRLNGIMVQEDAADWDVEPLTSEGLFVADAAGLLAAASPGDRVRVTGTVAELDGVTALTGLTQALTCPSGTSSVAAPVTLPLDSAADWERYEGMLVTLSQDLTVIDNAELGLTGSLTLAAGTRPLAYTQTNIPSAAGYTAYEVEVALRTVVLDDGAAVVHPDPIPYPPGGLSASSTIRAGDMVAGLRGVVDQLNGAYRIQPTQMVAVTAANARPAVPAFAGANVRVAFVSLDYFFTTIPIDPALSPGASSYEEYDRQLTKLVSLLKGLDADVIALSKLENDGYQSGSAIANLVEALNAAPAAGAYAWIAPSSSLWGNDATSVGIIYRTAAVAPTGGTAGLETGAFSQTASPVLHRQPMAQSFETIPWGERFTVVVNDWHGRDACPDPGDENADEGDGQACWNAARTAAAQDLAAWLDTDPTASHDPDILVLGELNAFAAEDPVAALEAAVYVNPMPAEAYTIVGAGRAGAVDHVLVTRALAAQVAGAAAWAANADEPAALDYNMEYKTNGQLTSLYAPDAYRASDHDPLIVGLTLLPDVSTLGGGYGTAWHTGQGEVRLGEEWSGNVNDGVVRVEGSWNDGEGSVSVTVGAAAGTHSCLDAWLDFGNGEVVAGEVETPDGAWSDGEHVIAGKALGPGMLQLVTFALPPGIIDANAEYNMRFRLTPAPDPSVGACPSAAVAAVSAALQPIGRADGGEVEDYTFEPGPLAVTLAAFAAAPAGDAIAVTWETVSELDTLGFHVYRGGTALGPWTRLNATLIASQAPGSGMGHAYEWLDGGVEGGRTYFYLLEDVGMDGASTLHGPISAASAGPTAVALGSFAGKTHGGLGLPLALLALLAAGAWRIRRRGGVGGKLHR